MNDLNELNFILCNSNNSQEIWCYKDFDDVKIIFLYKEKGFYTKNIVISTTLLKAITRRIKELGGELDG